MNNNNENMFGTLGIGTRSNNIANLFSQLGIKSQKEIRQQIKNALAQKRREAAKRGAATRAARREGAMNTGPKEASRHSTRVIRKPNTFKPAFVSRKKGAKKKGSGKGKKSNGSGCSAQAGPSPLNFGLAQAGPSPFGSAQPRAYPNMARYLFIHNKLTKKVNEGKLSNPSPKQRAYLKKSFNNFILAYSMLEPNTNKNGACAMEM